MPGIKIIFCHQAFNKAYHRITVTDKSIIDKLQWQLCYSKTTNYRLTACFYLHHFYTSGADIDANYF